MTPDERNMLTELANKVAQTPPPAKDAEAEDFIRTRIGNRPDALYLMTQTVLIQNLALQNAQHQIQELQQRVSQGGQIGAGSFIGQQSSSSSSGYAPAGNQQYSSPQPPPQYAPAPPPNMPSSSGMSGFLRGAAQTASGVAAGTLAAEAIGSLFSHHSYGGGFGGFGGGGGTGFLGGAPAEETVVNNYYDSPRDDFSNRGSDVGSGSDFVDPGTDDSSQYDDTSNVDDSSFDDTGDSGSDNSGDNFS